MNDYYRALLGTSPALFEPAPVEQIPFEDQQVNDGPDISLEEFIHEAWHVLHPHAELQWGRHNAELAKLLEEVSTGEGGRNIAINVPPGSMKSLLVNVFWVAWEWTFKSWTSWLFATHNGKLATRDSVRCGDLIASGWYQSRWGNRFKLLDQNKTYLRTNTLGRRLITSPSSGATGERADRIVVDDLIPAKAAHSETKREGANLWFLEELQNRKNSKATCTLGIGQRLHERDIFGVLEELGHFEWVVLPTRYHPDRFQNDPRDKRKFIIQDWRTEQGELLHEERHDAEADAQERKVLGPYGYAGQHDQVPTPPAGAILKSKWMNVRWTQLPEGEGEWIQAWDCKQGGLGKRTSFVVGQLWFRLSAEPGRIYLVDQVRAQHWDIEDTMAEMFRLSKCPLWRNAERKLVEKKADGAAVMTMLEKKVPGLTPFQPGSRSKEDRWRSVVPFWEAGNVCLPSDMVAHAESWLDDFIAEHVTAPGSAFDDQIDTSTMAIMHYFIDNPFFAFEML